MQPVAFLRKAWKKWEKKRTDKRNTRASTFHYVPSPRRSRSWSYRSASNAFRRTTLPKPEQISFDDYTNSVLASHKWITIKRHKSTVKESTSYCGEQATSLCRNPRRESQPASPLTCFTIPPASKYASRNKQDDRASDFHPRRGRNSSIPSPLPSLRLLPPTDVNYDQDDNLAAYRSERSSVSSRSSPNIPCLSIVEKSSSLRGQTARIATRRTRLSMITPPTEPPDSPGYLTDRLRPKTESTSSPKGYGGHTSPPPKIPVSTIQSGDFHEFPLSLFPQPPPLLVRKKVPKPLALKPSFPSSHSSLLPYSPLGSPASPRPRSLRSLSQASFASSTKRGLGRPLTSVSPPKTSPPNSPLPNPPIDKLMDSNLLSPSACTSVKASIRSCETPTQQVYRRSAEYSS